MVALFAGWLGSGAVTVMAHVSGSSRNVVIQVYVVGTLQVWRQLLLGRQDGLTHDTGVAHRVFGQVLGEPVAQFGGRGVTDVVEEARPGLLERRLIDELRAHLCGDGSRLIDAQHAVLRRGGALSLRRTSSGRS